MGTVKGVELGDGVCFPDVFVCSVGGEGSVD